jgi:hypothetical protein
VSYRPLGDTGMLRRTWTRITGSRLVRTTRWECIALLGVEVTLALVHLPLLLHLAVVVTAHLAVAFRVPRT